MKETPVSATRRRRGRIILTVIGAILLGLLVKFILHLVLPRNFTGIGEKIIIHLPHGPYHTLFYNGPQKPRGIVILATGDGGWSYWEENVAKHLMRNGYAVGGWDCRKFADSRKYDHSELVAGFNAAVKAIQDRTGADDVPIWYGGWSTGAEQSVAAAADPSRPEKLVGLILAAPGEHGRYGITGSDLLGVEPSGPDTFALVDLAPKLKGLAVAQFAAGLDPLDDSSWLKSLRGTPHETIKMPGSLHDMGGAGPEFQEKFTVAMKWTLEQTK